jgi:hypothetical protein
MKPGARAILTLLTLALAMAGPAAARALSAEAASAAQGGESAAAYAGAAVMGGKEAAATRSAATGAGTTAAGVSQAAGVIDACFQGGASAQVADCTTAAPETLTALEGGSDAPPSTDYSCEQQAGYGKCVEAWMYKNALCLRSCGRCGGGCADAQGGCEAGRCGESDDYLLKCLKTCWHCAAEA